MRKVLSLILVFVLCLSLCACGSKSAIVGTWRTYIAGTTFTYVFDNNTYTYTFEGAINLEGKGKYVLNEDSGTIRLIKDDGEVTHTVELRDCCMIFNRVQYGKAYKENEKCEVLDVLLGKWDHSFLDDVYLEFNKDGTYLLMYNGEPEKGLYIYDPVEETVRIPGASLTFKFNKTFSGTELYETNNRSLSFSR